MDYSKIIPINKIQPEVHIVNYFTLDKKRNNWGPRVIPDFEMILIREGTFTYIEHEEALNSFPVMGRIRGRVHISLEPGDLLIIPPGVNHTFKAEVANGAISCIHNQPIKGILGEGRRITISPTPLYSTDWSDNMDLINNLFLRCNDLFNGYHAYREELLGTICREIWLHCAIKWEIFSGDTKISERMEKMMVFIRNNCSKDIGRIEIADQFNLAPEYVNSLFKHELGISPTASINRERILKAYSMINNEGLSVKETAYNCGFKDPFYFSRVFKKVLGIAPGTLRGKTFFH